MDRVCVPAPFKCFKETMKYREVLRMVVNKDVRCLNFAISVSFLKNNFEIVNEIRDRNKTKIAH